MIDSKIIIVGGGPAGSACAWKLKQAEEQILILDRKPFPRSKLCAGWINPKALNAIDFKKQEYPFLLHPVDRIHFYLFGVHIPVQTRQYAIRRVEFDDWMVKRANVPVHTHTVKKIIKKNGFYIIDNQYRCQYLVGAGGTHCPVFRVFFSKDEKRPMKSMIAAVEQEYVCDYQDSRCHIWFFDKKLPGYSWYLPKGNGWLNIGIGGKFLKMKKQGTTIIDHWRYFTQKLLRLSLINKIPEMPKGHTYYLRHRMNQCQKDNVFVIGDAAGLSTLDMGEGIHAAIAGGILAAKAIVEKKEFRVESLGKFSLPGMIFQNKRSHKEFF
ncbi:NAD(P)/FAD-dependent oxidoreductase [Desulfobacula toluolica]|uniref:Geranylgeranyl reductase n=1 Tax=Desulfobacula toluolica (strain DSM 7467 / Tol2) TaxID=651182 RepID=K0NJE4_DESTT|nr:NAD(P)/FAD-dependent oxidoreductase [Desulfobacula toluolica]CCK80990.1 geranylgeranyl reductase [Desulfobacula toluolica Tol2]